MTHYTSMRGWPADCVCQCVCVFVLMTSYPDNPIRGLGPVGPGVNRLLTMGLKLQLQCERSHIDDD